MIEPGGVLQIFSRDPVPGKTKTRLIPLLGEQGAVDLHMELLERVLRTAQQSYFNRIELWHTSSSVHPLFLGYAQRFNIQLNEQTGDDLGHRMHQAICHALTQYEFAVLIGSDCPILSIKQLNTAYEKLAQGNDAVFGATEDGGYYLIGMRQSDISIFQDIVWGRSDVAEMTRMKMRLLGWQWIELDKLWDVDRPEDYARMQSSEYAINITNRPI